MSEVITLPGKRYDASGRETGETGVTLWRASTHGAEVLLAVGNRRAWVNAADLRAAIDHLVTTADMVGITYSGGKRL